MPAEDAELTHVVPGSPGGEYLRRFWHRIAPIPAPFRDGAPDCHARPFYEPEAWSR